MLTETRAQATGIANFLLALVIGAVVTWFIQLVTNPLFDYADSNVSDPTATTTQGWLEAFVTNVPVMFLFLSFFSLIALSVFEREVLR